jgi:stringent starvation protein B
LRLTTLISLIPKEPENYLREWCEDNNVELISFQVQKPKENIPLSFSKIGQIIQVTLNWLQLALTNLFLDYCR